MVSAATLAGFDDLPASVPGVGPLDPVTARRLARHRPWRRLLADPETGTLLTVDTRRVSPPQDEGGPPPETEGAPPPDGRWARLLAGLPTSLPPVPRPDEGVDAYRPTAQLRRYVHSRDATCIGPACHHPAAGTQLDHTVSFGPPTGSTSHDNLGSVCERIHNAKTHGGWLLEQPEPGTFTWTSPTGRSYARPARPLVHGWTGDDP